MSLFITSLNSGSNGNCYYIGNKKEAILIDCGISCKEVEKRMLRLKLDLGLVKAIFISHEHSDHIKGIEVLCKKFGIPVYCTLITGSHCGFPENFTLINYFINGDRVKIGELEVQSFCKKHDASDPCSFSVTYKKIKVGVFTDMGVACTNVIHHFSQCHAAFLEANYDTDMLTTGLYPWHLKKRISSGLGHLSNDEAFALFISHRSPFLTHLVLSHLSKNNNCPDKVAALFASYAEEINVVVASRNNETEVYEIGAKAKEIYVEKEKRPTYVQAQFSFV